jgi:Autophagy-related protein 27
MYMVKDTVTKTYVCMGGSRARCLLAEPMGKLKRSSSFEIQVSFVNWKSTIPSFSQCLLLSSKRSNAQGLYFLDTLVSLQHGNILIMRLHRSTRPNAAMLSFLLFPGLITAYTLTCNQIVSEGQSWDLSKLGGPHSVMESHETPPTWKNTTYTLDICRNLKKKKGECPSGTRGKL